MTGERKKMLEDFGKEDIMTPLFQWFAGHARILPWREKPTPYRVWISEIMLQQTRVEAVKPYFERFVEALPDVETLAACPEDRLLKLWEGLGYYNRARNLQAAARQIVRDYQGEMPSGYEELLKLKGIGHYTAGAVTSIAFGRKAAAVDGNVLRVITRLTCDDTDIMKTAFREKMEAWLTDRMPDGYFGDCNQALMELGATVCVPNGAPKCEACPWESICLAHGSGREMLFPVKSKPRERRIEQKTVLLIRDGDRIVLRKRPARGLLAGLYEFPAKEGVLSEKEALKRVEEMGFSPLRITPLPEAKHIFSHVEWHMTGYMIRVAGTEKCPEGMLLAEREQVERDYSIPSAYAAYTKLMNIRLGIKDEGG